MSDSQKIWVIDVEKEPETSLPHEVPSDTDRLQQEIPVGSRTPLSDPGSPRGNLRRERVHFAGLFLFSYLLGPFALLLTSRGRRSKILASVALVTGFAGMAAWWNRQDILSWSAGGYLFLLWFLFAALLILAGFTVWAYAVYLAGSDAGRPTPSWPKWLTKPWMVGGLGIFAPGLGFLVTGYPKRAAAVLWSFWPATLALLVLIHAAWLWDWQRGSGAGIISTNSLEMVLLAAVLVTSLGVLGWIAQALEGARLVSTRYGTWRRPRGDWYAAALLGALVILAAVSEPTTIAARLDRLGASLRQEGFRVIPLCLTLTAYRLDPSHPAYVLQAIDLYDEIGKSEAAVRLREELDENMKPYVMMLQHEGLSPWAVTPPPSTRQDRSSERIIADQVYSPQYFVGPYLDELRDHSIRNRP